MSTIRCGKGEPVHVVFRLDTSDREDMSFVASIGRISGEMMRDLMLTSVEHRFGAEARRTPHSIEWFSDNGSCYMAGAFVKTFKRDYVYLNELGSAESVIRQLPAWFHDVQRNRTSSWLENALAA